MRARPFAACSDSSTFAFRRYLNYRHKGRGFGWKQYPNAALYARGMIYIGSGVIQYARAACACRVRKTVGPPDSGKTERPVGWEGMVGAAMDGRLLRHCNGGNPPAAARPSLTPLSHSFTLDIVLGFQEQSGCRSVPGGTHGTNGEIQPGTAPRENTTSGVWSACDRPTTGARRREAGDV